jgi:DNA (cytosine-5)-methyltransferase 1/tRNA (cytosine38-C5)-methyltransferase
LELFCGIGGFAAAATTCPKFQIVGAIDINQLANSVYRHNFAHPVFEFTLESISVERLTTFDADLWWLSPPCQPFTSRGKRVDLNDPRSQALNHLLDVIEQLHPKFIMLENVARFRSSQMASKMRATLQRLGYRVFQWLICPTQLGIANRRLRYYLLATKHPIFDRDPLPAFAWNELSDGLLCRNSPPLVRKIKDILIEDNWDNPRLRIPAEIQDRYTQAINWVDEYDSEAISSCFTSAYGKSPVYSGSYLKRGDRARYFCPLEISRLLGFDLGFTFPAGLSYRQQWNLVGNSLSVHVVRLILKQLEPIFKN